MRLADGHALLATKVVGDLDGHSFVPVYQRGYRWGRPEVQRLLDDVEAVLGLRPSSSVSTTRDQTPPYGS